MKADAVVFAAAKLGSTEDEWEDGAAGAPIRSRTDGSMVDCARFIVADGATEAFDAIRWVDYIVSSFVDQAITPTFGPAEVGDWFAWLQERWESEKPAALNYFEEQKLTQGSFATFLGCEITGLSGRHPSWHAGSLGDTVLFHVRDGQLVTWFPRLTAGDFGTNPDGIHTNPAQLDSMVGAVDFDRGELLAHDLLFIATDAFAHWMLTLIEAENRFLWQMLSGLHHPSIFSELVNEQRECGAMTNDDVTLLRVRVAPGRPQYLVACLS